MSAASSESHVRAAAPMDAPAIHAMMMDLAEYHGLRHLVVTSLGDICCDLIGPDRLCETLVAATTGDDLLGYACFYPIYSAFSARRAIFLEHIHVDRTARGRGVGGELLDTVLAQGRAMECRHVDLHVSTWHTSAQRFYTHAGFLKQNEYLYRYVLDAQVSDDDIDQASSGGG